MAGSTTPIVGPTVAMARGAIEFGRLPQVAVSALINNTYTLLSYNTSTGKAERIPSGQLPSGPFGNAAKFPVKCVRGVTQTQAEAGYQSRDGLDPLTLCLGTVCYAEFAPTEAEKTTRLVFNGAPDPANPFKVYIDGSFTGNLIDAKWVPLNSPEAAAAGILPFNAFYPQGYKQRDGATPASIVTAQDAQGVTRFALALQNMSVAQFPQGIPAPVFDGPPSPYWREASPPRAEQAAFQYLNNTTAKALASEEGILWDMPYIIQRFGPPEPGELTGPQIGSVLIYGLDGTHFTEKGYLLPLNGSQPQEGRYNLATDTFVIGGSDFSPAGFPGYFSPETQVLFEYNAQTNKLFGSLYGQAVAVGNLKADVLERLPTLQQRYAMLGTVGSPSAVNPYVTDQDPRLSYALRVITARDRFGTFYQGADNDLGGAVAGMLEHVVFNINQTYTNNANVTLKRGAILLGQYRSFRLAGFILTLPQDSILQQLKIENIATNGQEGRISSAYAADNTGTPRIKDCLLYEGHYHVAANCYLRVIGGDIAVNDWNRGDGTIFLENVRETGTRGVGAGFAAVVVRGGAAGGAGLPSQTGNAGRVLGTDGAVASWVTPTGGSGVDDTEVEVDADITLTAAGLNKSYAAGKPTPGNIVFKLPAEPGSAKADIILRVAPSMPGLVELDGNGNALDGEAKRYLQGGESRRLRWNGTKWRKVDNGVTIPFAAKIRADGSGSYSLAGGALQNHALPNIVYGQAGMTTAADKLTVLRAGRYTLNAGMSVYGTISFQEANLFAACNGAYNNPKSEVDIDGRQNTDGVFRQFKLKIPSEVSAAVGDTFQLTTYCDQSLGVDNRAANPAYMPFLQLIEQNPW